MLLSREISPEERKQLHFSEQKELLLSLLGKMVITKDQYNHCIRDLMLETGIDEDHIMDENGP